MNDLILKKDGKYILADESIKTIIQIENEIKALKELQDNYKELLLKAMEEHDILKLDGEELTLTRIPETTKETFNAKKLKKENLELYDKYVNITPVKSSLRIKIKEVK